MSIVVLLNTTGKEKVDEIICGIIGIFETVFPDRIRGYYLTGSYSDGSAVTTSDIDIYIVFKDSFTNGEEVLARQLWLYCRQICFVKIDLIRINEERLLRVGNIGVKLATLLMYGEDIREKIPLPVFDTYLQGVTEASFSYLAGALRDADSLVFPLDYPDPAGVFYGYDAKDWGTETKGLVSSVCRAATAIVALKGGRYVGKKSDSIKSYKDCINDEWTGFLEEMYEEGRERWGYRIPEDAVERDRLRELCRRTLAFENHYLSIYREYLLAQLRREDDSCRLFAVKRLGETIYADEEIIDALRADESRGGEELRQAVQETMQKMRSVAI